MYGWRRKKDQSAAEQAPDAVGDFFDAPELLNAIDAVVARYLKRVDQSALVYPACKRKHNDQEGDPRSIWAHTRLEAVRYITMVPGRQAELLVEPARQLEIFEIFLRKQPDEKFIIEFSGIAADDLVLAINAGLNWLNHCALLAGADHSRFSGTLRNFRKISSIAHRWWAMEGAEARCNQMRETQRRPPLMLHLVWQYYTALTKEIAATAVFGPSIERTVMRRRKMLEENFAERPSELAAAIGELNDTVHRFEAAREPDDLPG